MPNTTTPIEPNLARAFDLVMQLMAIPGKSGEEQAAAEFIIERLQAAGAPADAIRFDTANRRTAIAGQTGNLILKLPGTVRAPRRMLSSHIDTVPICVGSQPKRKGNVVTSAAPGTGLGADNRAGAATILSAALTILENKLPHPPLTFVWFVQEEIGLQGSRCVNKPMLGSPKLAFNWDGGAPHKLTIGATGGYRMTIDVQGIASHAGGAPEHGVSAIAIASIAIAELHRGGWHGLIQQGKQLGTSNVGYIHGGEATNVVTDRVQLRAEARSHNPAFRERIVKQIEKAFRSAAKEVKNVDGKSGAVSFDGQTDYESFRLEKNEPCVLAAEAAVKAIGRDPQLAIANGGLDANWTTRHGIPTVTLGCGQVNQHMVTEALMVDEFLDACRIAFQLATASEAV